MNFKILKNILIVIMENPAFSGISVEKMGLEPTTPCMPCKCSSQLSYIPLFFTYASLSGRSTLPIAIGS